MALDAGATISPAERLALLKYLKPDLLAHAPVDQRVKLLTQAWMTLPAGDRKTFQEAAIAQMNLWGNKQPAAALAWYREMAAQGKLSVGLESGEPLTQLAGTLLFTMMIKSAAGAREFLNSLAPEGRSEALRTSGRFAGDLAATHNLISLAKELPPAEGVEPDMMTVAKGLTAGYAPMGALFLLYAAIPG